MAVKPKIAFYWCSSCGGCEESILDMGARLLDVAEAAEIVFWPVAIDTKYDDLRSFEDGSIAACFINGSLRLDEHLDMVTLLRRKARLVVAQGACAHLGGVYGLGNLSSADGLLKTSYELVPSGEKGGGSIPQPWTEVDSGFLQLPRLIPRVKALNQVIPVDYFIPGCPPVPDSVYRAVEAIISGSTFPNGYVFADDKALCDSCPRGNSKPDRIKVRTLKRFHEIALDLEACFLAQDVICLGPATRGGCQSRCINANMPCRGCFGPPGSIDDQGGKSLSFIASLLEFADSPEGTELLSSLPDLGGLIYRYSLPTSILKGRMKVSSE
jgi:F420-non-reducing hydrogenase small subunit